MDRKELKQAGLKVTTPRLKILELLEQLSERHLSAEEIYLALQQAGEDVGLATVYRVLTQFCEAGLLKRHNFEDDHAVYELDTGAHHDHLVCLKCGKVEEFIDEVIEQRQAAIADRSGFHMTDHSLNIYGICHKCRVD